ncbi:hypothetical protein [Enterococcus sp. AZ109]
MNFLVFDFAENGKEKGIEAKIGLEKYEGKIEELKDTLRSILYE